jgi:hypothetical protein
VGWYGRDGRDGLNRKGGIGRKGWEEGVERQSNGKGGMRREGGMEWIHDSKGGMEWEGRDEKRWEW